MCADSVGPIGIGYLTVILAALNVALNSWLAHRRLQADKREFKRNGSGNGPVGPSGTASAASISNDTNRREVDKE